MNDTEALVFQRCYHLIGTAPQSVELAREGHDERHNLLSVLRHAMGLREAPRPTLGGPPECVSMWGAGRSLPIMSHGRQASGLAARLHARDRRRERLNPLTLNPDAKYEILVNGRPRQSLARS